MLAMTSKISVCEIFYFLKTFIEAANFLAFQTNNNVDQ